MRVIPSPTAVRVLVSLQHFGVPLGVSGNCPAGEPLPSQESWCWQQWTSWTREASTI